MKKTPLSIKQFPSKFACGNERLSIKLGAKVLFDPGRFVILSHAILLDFNK